MTALHPKTKAKKTKTLRKASLENIMAALIETAGLPHPQAEFRFHPKRMWRFDFAFIDYKVAVEVEGGAYANPVYCRSCGARVTYVGTDGRIIPLLMGGRHNFGAGYEKDVEKYNEAAIHGWLLVRMTAKLVRSKKGLEFIARALKERGWEGEV